jgi:hypothetical protein
MIFLNMLGILKNNMDSAFLFGILGGLCMVSIGLAFAYIFADNNIIFDESLKMTDEITTVLNP